VASKNQVNLTLTDEQMAGVIEAVERYHRRNPQAVFMELYELFFSKWCQAQELALSSLEESDSLGKASAAGRHKSPSPSQRRKTG